MNKSILLIITSLLFGHFCNGQSYYDGRETFFYGDHELINDPIPLNINPDSVFAICITKEETLSKINKYPNIKYLKIKGIDIKNYRLNLDIKVLELSNCDHLDNDFFSNLNKDSLKAISITNSIIKNFSFLALLTNLEYLELNEVDLVFFPDEIEKLKNLKTLKLTNNNLTSIPDFVFLLDSISTFWYRYNEIVNLPDSMIISPSLQTIVFDGTIFDDGELCKFINSNISTLSCNDCNITDFPYCVLYYKNIESLLLLYNEVLEISYELLPDSKSIDIYLSMKNPEEYTKERQFNEINFLIYPEIPPR